MNRKKFIIHQELLEITDKKLLFTLSRLHRRLGTSKFNQKLRSKSIQRDSGKFYSISEKFLKKQIGLPVKIEKLFTLFIPHEDLDEFLGDMQEKFNHHCENYGSGFATQWLWLQAIRSLCPLLTKKVFELGKALIKINMP